MKITWLGHSSVKIETGSMLIYIDPYAGNDEWYSPADLILVSQWHFDHCNMEKLKRISINGHILATPEVASQIHPCGVLRPGESRLFGDVEVVGVPVVHKGVMYRGHTHDEVSRLGFVIISEGKKIYFMGSSEFISGFERMHPDVLLISVGGTYTPDAKESARNAALIEPKLAIPVCWGSIEGSRDDAELFGELAGVPVKILNPGDTVVL